MERDRRSAATALLWPEPPPALTLAGRPTPMSDVVPAPTLSELKPPSRSCAAGSTPGWLPWSWSPASS